jgi:thiamine biosynthesis lipoprotein
MAVDAALAVLREHDAIPALVSAGGDLAVAGLPPGGDTWPIAITGLDRHWTVPLRAGAIATSGLARRRWQQGGQLRHHLVDPRTSLPADSDLWSVSVAAARCVQAEVAAKAAFILGPAAGAAFINQQRLAGLLVTTTGEAVTVGSWPALMPV